LATDIYRTMSEQISHQLRDEILSGRLAEGEPLQGERLAKRFGVSRGPIRDALLKLTHEGLVVSEPNVGVRVASGPSQAMRPLVLKVRREIETFAFSLIFDQISDDDIRQWGEVIERIRSACEQGDRVSLVGHDTTFHRMIIERTGDRDLLAMWQPFAVRMMLRYSGHRGINLMEIYADHRAIFEAISARDKKTAIKALGDSFK
jgi:GntR family transcriptional regulator, rspAB operon transcriptional repressor